MITSFVGMMVKSLQKRNGRRREVAYTIHHLIAVGKYNKFGADWFARFEILCLDEFSNVSMSLFRKLICLFPKLKKIVLVGDHRQLKPIDCGDPMGDLIDCFGSQMLHDNLRVTPGLQALQIAPYLISSGRAREISFSNPFAPNGGPISFVQKTEEPEDVLRPIFKQILSNPKNKINLLMNTHIVVLLNKSADGRHKINEACEKVWLSLGVLKMPKNGREIVEVRYKLNLFVGCKIVFMQNYNTPIAVKIGNFTHKSDTVANGELAIVKSISKCADGRGIKMIIVDSEDKADDPETKEVWIDAKQGVHPMHVDLGYSSSTYRTQGNYHILFS
jgi:hypothetical protein